MATRVELDPLDPAVVRKLRVKDLRKLAQSYGIPTASRRKADLLTNILDFMHQHAPPLTPWQARDLDEADVAIALRLRGQPVPDDPKVATAMLVTHVLGQLPGAAPALPSATPTPTSGSAAPSPAAAAASATPAGSAAPTPSVQTRAAASSGASAHASASSSAGLAPPATPMAPPRVAGSSARHQAAATAPASSAASSAGPRSTTAAPATSAASVVDMASQDDQLAELSSKVRAQADTMAALSTALGSIQSALSSLADAPPASSATASAAAPRVPAAQGMAQAPAAQLSTPPSAPPSSAVYWTQLSGSKRSRGEDDPAPLTPVLFASRLT